MKIWTLEEARETLPRVKSITENYYNQVKELKEKAGEKEDPEERETLNRKIETIFREWAGKIQDLGVEVKGPWIVDFDSGDGIYYCWKHGEEELKYFHRYESGFKGRKPLEKLPGHSPN